jgi:hypothetical protein
MTITLLLTMIAVQRLQSTIYYTTLIKSFFKYQPPQLMQDNQQQQLLLDNTKFDKAN